MNEPRTTGDVPMAEVQPAAAWRRLRFFPTGYWLLTACCLAVAIALVVWSRRHEGPRILIRFEQGHGLKPGDRLRHRGIEVGEVRAVRLDGEFNRVSVEVALEPSASELARDGSLFWIERPQLGLGRIRGLETVVGAKYLGVSPGARDAPPKFEFQGEEHPLTLQGTRLREIVVRFQHGNGLGVGDPVRHRGIEVGEVVGVDLATDLTHVEVRARLQGFASGLARAGSRFWVERPQLSLAGVSGLETVVGGRYLAVLPGPPQAAALDEFDGFETPPTARLGGLEIVLESPRRLGVEVGAPVLYRGMKVGAISAVRLAPDSTQVETRAHIEASYRSLVCDNTRFWSTGGFDIGLGWTGVEVNAETLQTIAAGGVSFATPDDPGEPVSTGHRFSLLEEADEGWMTWTPRLASGPTRLPDGSILPEPQPLSLLWGVKQFGFTRDRQRTGLVLPLDDGRWLGPRDLFTPTGKALASSARLEFGGAKYDFRADQLRLSNELAYYRVVPPPENVSGAWSVNQIRLPGPPEDCFIVTGTDARVIPLAASRLARVEDSWTIQASFTAPPEWHGASVVAAADRKLVAILEVDADHGRARALFVK